MTSMWKIYDKPTEYLFQTYDATVADKMRKRKNFILFSRGLNCNFWVYIAPFQSLSKAKKALSDVGQGRVVFNALKTIYEVTPLSKSGEKKGS